MNSAYFINSIGIEFVKIDAGYFFMGADSGDLQCRNNESPIHRVELDSFYISIYPITQFQYQTVISKNPSYFSNNGKGAKFVKDYDTSDFPVESVSWIDSTYFCEKLSLLKKEMINGRAYRLPKESEWEYACRGRTTGPFNTGTKFTSLDANICGLYPYGTLDIHPYLNRTTSVGQYRPNGFGLYDMHGNVWEWCLETYYSYGDPSQLYENIGILRGGAWNCYSRFCRSSYRSICEKKLHYFDAGFRIICYFP